MQRVRTKHLDVALSDSGPKDGPVAPLLHRLGSGGWRLGALIGSRITQG